MELIPQPSTSFLNFPSMPETQSHPLPPPPAYANNPGTSSSEGSKDDVQVKMEPVLSLAMAQLKDEIEMACTQLGIGQGN